MTKKQHTEVDSRRKQYIRKILKKESKDLKFCVLGAGHGGTAMAGHLATMGFHVNLYNRGRKRLRAISHRKGIKVEGEVNGFGKIMLCSNNIQECIEDVDVLMVAVPANGHRFIAEMAAPTLKENQIVILNPGRTGGTLEFLHMSFL